MIALVASVNGRRQLTYDGHPLYLYAGDQKPGDTPGRGLNEFGDAWHLVSPSDETIDED